MENITSASMELKSKKNTNAIKRSRFLREKLLPFVLLLPTLIAIGILVYAFIFWTIYISFSNWNTASLDLSFAGLKNYIYLFNDYRFQADFRNTIVFTIMYIISAIVLGLGLAVFLDSRLKGESFFRNLFIFPMSVSFIVSGVAWQWLLNPSTGYNKILESFGMEDLPLWYVNTEILFPIPFGQIEFGIPMAQFSILIAILWQTSGYAMALFLAGLRSVSEDVREAGRIDGASEFRILWKIVIPMLRPVTVSVIIIVTHISLKIFDLILVMTGPGAAFVTDMPGINMYETTFKGQQYAHGAVIAVMMLVLVSLFIIPYLINSHRKEEG